MDMMRIESVKTLSIRIFRPVFDLLSYCRNIGNIQSLDRAFPVNRLLYNFKFVVDFRFQRIHIPLDFIFGNLRINLGSRNMFMSKHFRYGFYRYSLR